MPILELPRLLENASLAESLALLPASDRETILAELSDYELEELEHDWYFWARPKQLPPEGDWITWYLEAGRGFGKTRTGGGWFHKRMMEHAGRWGAMIGKTPADVRDYMIEGPGGILRNCPPKEQPRYEPSKRRVTWPNGSWGTVYSSEEAEQLRGFSGDTAWLDELAKYTAPKAVWDNLQFGMREISDDQPRILITTTPKPIPLLQEIAEKETTVVVNGSSYENRANLAPTWFDQVLAAYEGTALGDQEIHGIRLDDVEGRVYSSFSRKPYPEGNVDATVADDGRSPLYVGQDFNVNPMSTVIGQKRIYKDGRTGRILWTELHVIDALEIPASNTDEVCKEVQSRYPGRRVIFCPDPSGRANKTSASGKTDFSIIESYGFETSAPLAAPPVRDRENNANAMYLRWLTNPDGSFKIKDGKRIPHRRVRVHPRCKALLTALGSLQFKEGTSQRDKKSGYDHICDAIDYLLWDQFCVIYVGPAVAIGGVEI